MRTLKIASVNVRGLGGQQKRRDVLHYLRNRNYDVIFLQDTHLTKNKIPFFDSGKEKRITRITRIPVGGHLSLLTETFNITYSSNTCAKEEIM